MGKTFFFWTTKEKNPEPTSDAFRTAMQIGQRCSISRHRGKPPYSTARCGAVRLLSIPSKKRLKAIGFCSHSGAPMRRQPRLTKAGGRIPFDLGVSLNQHQTRFTQRSAKSSDRHIPKKRAAPDSHSLVQVKCQPEFSRDAVTPARFNMPLTQITHRPRPGRFTLSIFSWLR